MSHGGRLDEGTKERREFFKREIKEERPCYDPTDPEHQAFVKRWQEKAHDLVVAEFDKLLGS